VVLWELVNCQASTNVLHRTQQTLI